ncbi:sensor domain-containing diguanylate cyclase [Aquitalea aquatica]|uniref:Sensor domain-containing diguanylate cyclase n=1 Tax=Aquitalea aquatica TaxID=3044273 RepID=A0A838YGK7_9NEIS|nr:sensor domain-containing diguanylate cyclase [Aquitalea magnusonii]MBA4709864.1 sensor domain-containing diguanylate cyclase [Aquitalea magnusonii]
MRIKLATLACTLLWFVLSALIAMAFLSRAVLSAEQEFDLLGTRLSEQLTQKLQVNDTILDSYAAFAMLGHQHEAQEQIFARQMAERYPQLVSLERIRRISQQQLPLWHQQMVERWGSDFRLHAYTAGSLTPLYPLPAYPDYYPIESIQPLTQAVRPLLGADIARDPQLQQALQQALRSGRTTMSAPFQLREGYRGHVLLQPFNDSALLLQGRKPEQFVALVLRSDYLRPADTTLPAGMKLSIRQRGQSPAAAYVDIPGQQHGWLSTLGFPRLQLQRELGSEAQPLTLRLDWQLGWFLLSGFELSVIFCQSLLLLLLLVVGLRFYSGLLSKQQRRENHLFYLANHDRLTGLANRNLFYDRLQHAISRLNRNGKRLAVLFLDMDRFKPVNDSYGHATGDKVLQLIAARILAIMRSEDTVARLGGDEFVLLMEDVESNREADRVLERLKHAIQQPYEVDGHSIQLGVSIGIAYYPEDGMLIEELLDVADRKMYGDKQPELPRN